MDAISLSIFSSQLNSVCHEMGAVLQQASFSPNIKDRLDFSCAIFDASGALCAQAAHIPVHLGSMAYAMRDIVNAALWQEGDMLIVNDPYLGGTHLPDVTLIAPVFCQQQLMGFVVNRAHHADIGAESPGSMPISSHLDEEGVLIAPRKLVNAGVLDEQYINHLLSYMADATLARGDFFAQISANKVGVKRLQAIITAVGVDGFAEGLDKLNEYGARMADTGFSKIPKGRYRFSDYMDDDGQGHCDIKIAVEIIVDDLITVDFMGTAAQVKGNINTPLSVAAAAVYYVFRCLMPSETPACAGSFRRLVIKAPKGCLLNAERPAAVAAGNVETSTRVVDVLLGALAQAAPDLIPAASHGSMNNIAMGGRVGSKPWNYYETIGGGMGAGRYGGGLSGVQTHMTNTLNTPIESLEMHFPLRVTAYHYHRGSGGEGANAGGDGLVREFEFLENAQVTVLTERRLRKPWGLQEGGMATPGLNLLDGVALPPKTSVSVLAGQRLTLKTPGGGGWGKCDKTK